MARTLFVLCCCSVAGVAGPAFAAAPEEAAVAVLVTQRYPNPVRPWTSGSAVESMGTGVVIEGRRILTAAHVVLYATQVQVQARPGERKYEAKVAAIAPEMDLAILTIDDDEFFEKRSPLPRMKELPKVQDSVTVYGFPIGGNGLSVTDGVVSRIDFGNYFHHGAGLTIQISAPVNPGNSGGPAVVDGKLAGIVFSQLTEGQNIGYVIPNEEIDIFLADVADGAYDGKPVDGSGTRYQTLENLGPLLRGGPMPATRTSSSDSSAEVRNCSPAACNGRRSMR